MPGALKTLFAICLIVILLALTRESPALGTTVLVLAGTMGDIRVARKSASKIARISVLRRTLRRVGGQSIVLALVLLDMAGLGCALAAPVWLAPWAIINLMALVFGALNWSENTRMESETATALRRQAEKMRAAERRNLEECQREAQRQEEAERQRQVEQQLREAQQRLRQEEEEREAQKQQQAEQAERLRQAEQQLREAQQQRRQEEEEREAQKQQQAEQAERLRQAEQRLREFEQRQREEEEKREAHRKRQKDCTQAGPQFQADWWIVLGVAPSASKDEIARNYRHRIKQYHPDRVAGLAPELLQLAEERTKALNEAYENAMRTRWLGAA